MEKSINYTWITPKQALAGLENIIERQREQITHQKEEIAELKALMVASANDLRAYEQGEIAWHVCRRLEKKSKDTKRQEKVE